MALQLLDQHDALEAALEDQPTQLVLLVARGVNAEHALIAADGTVYRPTEYAWGFVNLYAIFDVPPGAYQCVGLQRRTVTV